MAGLLNKLLTTGQMQQAATVPQSKYATVSILVVNPTADDAEIELYISTQSQPGTIDMIDFKPKLAKAGGRCEYECVICSQGEKIFIKAPAGLVVRITSIEED